MKIVAINGSPNLNGNTYYLLKKMGEIITEDGIEFEIIHLNPSLLSLKNPFCVACSNPCNKSCYKNTDFEILMDKATKADGIIFGSPVYFGSMSAQLKAFFDKSRSQRADKSFLSKPACAVTVGASKYGGQETTTRAIHDCAMVLGMNIINDGFLEFDCGHFGVNAQRPSEKDEFANTRLISAAKRMIEEIKR
jgi:multimeric flavodoxin WrbA